MEQIVFSAEYSFFLALLLLSFFSITVLIQLSRRNRHIAFEKIIHAKNPPFVWRLARSLAQANTFDIVQFFLTGTQQALRIITIILISAWCVVASPIQIVTSTPLHLFLWIILFSAILSMLVIFLFDFLPRYFVSAHPTLALKLSYPLSNIALLVFFPFIVPILKIAQVISGSKNLHSSPTPREQLIHMIDDLDEDRPITDADQRLFESIVNFRKRIAREIMRPRVSVFCLPESISVREAAVLLQQEGYSRVPVYRETIDAITGVVFYKDILATYVSAQKEHREEELSEPITKYVKKIHYCPETKKISTLLQEFRKKQTHLALVVDEYGGTSGIVTIEDILEEIVGDIADEYDDVETFAQRVDDSHWIIDARVNILDLEEETGIQIPQEGEYDTVAGYIFFNLGTIPTAGHILHHDAYDMKILSCNDRMVEKVEITIHKPRKE